MKVQGKSELKKAQAVVTIDRGDEEKCSFLVTALPLGWKARIRVPDPPQRVKKTPGGGPRLDSFGNPEYYEDYRDPDYIRETKTALNRIEAVTAAQALRFDADVELESKDPGDDAKIDAIHVYADSLWKEFTDFGLTDDDLELIIRVAKGLGGPADIEEAARSFLPSHLHDPKKKVSSK